MGLLTGEARDELGSVATDASVTVYLAGTTSLATLFADPALALGMVNPVAVDARGGFAVFAADGLYDLLITRPGWSGDTIYGVPAVDPTAYLALAGRAGGQSPAGGVAAGEALTLRSTSHVTKGKINLGTSSYDEANNRFGINTSAPGVSLEVRGSEFVDGQADVVQLLVQGNATQNAYVLRVEKSDATKLFAVANSGVLEVAVHNAGGTVTGTQAIASGTYTPTGTGVTNVAAITPSAFSWMRVGHVVTCAGSVNVDPTTAGLLTSFGLSLPVASNLAVTGDVAGTDNYDNGAVITPCRVLADVANDRAQIDYYADSGAANRTHLIIFQYVVK